MDDFVWRHVHLTQLYSERLGNVFRMHKLQRRIMMIDLQVYYWLSLQELYIACSMQVTCQ